MNEKELQRVDQKIEDNVESSKEIEIDLMELFFRLIENAKKIIAGALVGMFIFAAYSFLLATPMYEATCKIYVMSASDSAINLSDLQIGAALTADYQEIFSTWEVHEQVLQNLGLDYSYNELEDMISITNPSSTRILAITVTSDDPAEAAAMANEYAAVASRYISDTMMTDEPSMLSKALEPTDPVSPRKVFNTALGFLLGALVMCAIVTVQFILDDKIKTAEDIRKYTGMPTLAVVPINGDFMSSNREKGGRKERF
ncbi:MAG: hypothetical protein J6M10_10225 [Clostridia bacterium]|nr:hypothetical protein [Clostridia bacterium]